MKRPTSDRRFLRMVATVLYICGLPLVSSADGGASPPRPRLANPQVVRVTDRLVAALEHLLGLGALPDEALSAFKARHMGATERGPFRISGLVPERAATTAKLRTARRLLELYDGKPVERELVMRWIAETLEDHRRERDSVEGLNTRLLPMDFVRVEPGKVSWRGSSIEVKEPFEVLSTPLLTEHWNQLRRPARSTPGYEPLPGDPVSFRMADIPELLAAINAHDTARRFEYGVISLQQWRYLAYSWGKEALEPFDKKIKSLLDYTWLRENSKMVGVLGTRPPVGTDLPHPVGPTRERKPHIVHGEPIWELLGNMHQIVVPLEGVRTSGRSHHLVGGHIYTSYKEFRSHSWVGYNWSGRDRGSVRLVRRPRRAVQER